MLIITERHTNEDLELWEEYKGVDLLNYKLNNIKRKEINTINIIKKFKPDYVSISWGKDSVVLADIILRNDLNYQFVNLRINPSRNIYCDDVRNKFLNIYSHMKYNEIIVDYNNIYERNLSDIEQNKETDKYFFKGFNEAGKIYGKRYISGIRNEESGIRTFVFKKYGIMTNNTCRPLSLWKTKDIFAYLHYYDLPIHPNYAMLGGGRWDRNKIRVAELGDTKGREMGRLLWEREYYGDILNKLRWDKIH